MVDGLYASQRRATLARLVADRMSGATTPQDNEILRGLLIKQDLMTLSDKVVDINHGGGCVVVVLTNGMRININAAGCVSKGKAA